MRVVALLVASVDGKITKGDEADIYTWTSVEDQEQFFAAIRAAKVICMGRKTWQAARDKIVLSPNTLRVVLTTEPHLFVENSIPGQLLFSAEQPTELVGRLAGEGYEVLLLVGGSHTIGSFLQAGLVTDLKLTIEPWLFGYGTSLLPDLPINQRLQLQSCSQLNDQGTVLLQYSVTH